MINPRSNALSKVILFSLCLVAALSLPGCWGVREPDELGFILVTGVDKGRENLIEVTFQIAVPQSSSGGGGGEKASTEVISLQSASLFGALQLANAFVSRDLTFIHNRMVVVSEEIAKEGLNKYINPLIRSREIRRNTYLAVSKGPAKEFIEKNKAVLETYPSRQIELLFLAQSFAGFMPVSIINEFYKSAKSPGEEAVTALVGINEATGHGKKPGNSVEEKTLWEMGYQPGEIPRQGGNKIDVIGMAVFRGDKLAGYLSGDETRCYQILHGDFRSAIMSFPDPEKPSEFLVVIKIKQGRSPNVKVNLQGEKPRVDVSILLEGEIMSIQSGINYEKGEKQQKLEKYLADSITAECGKMIKKTREELKSDIFGFGENTRKLFWTYPQWQKYNWKERYPDAEVKLETKVEIRRTGLMARTTSIKEE